MSLDRSIPFTSQPADADDTATVTLSDFADDLHEALNCNYAVDAPARRQKNYIHLAVHLSQSEDPAAQRTMQFLDENAGDRLLLSSCFYSARFGMVLRLMVTPKVFAWLPRYPAIHWEGCSAEPAEEPQEQQEHTPEDHHYGIKVDVSQPRPGEIHDARQNFACRFSQGYFFIPNSGKDLHCGLFALQHSLEHQMPSLPIPSEEDLLELVEEIILEEQQICGPQARTD